MTRRPAMVQNFRGVRAVVLHLPDRNRAVLTETLGKLGLSVLALEPRERPGRARRSRRRPARSLRRGRQRGRCAALDGGHGTHPADRRDRARNSEPAASRLCAAAGGRAAEADATTGIYTALFFAANEHRRRLEVQEQLRSLQARHGARRFVIKAVVELMRARGVDDDEAYRILRKESMRQRTTVEELAVRLVAAAGPAAGSVAAKEA